MLTPRLYAWTRAHPTLVDALIAAGLYLTFGLFSTAAGLGLLADGFSLVSLALLVVRRRWPVAVLSAMVVVGLAQFALVDTLLPANVAEVYVVYTVAAHVASFRTRLLALGCGVLGAALGALRLGGLDAAFAAKAFSALALAIVVMLTWVVGNIIRGRESIIAQLSESNLLLQRDRDQRDLIAAQHERARIAREMHDIVAHSLSVVVVQADGGAYAAEHASVWQRADAAGTLETIAGTARSALAETRRLVGVLRDDDAAADLSPLAGLADLESLVEGVRSSGLTVTTQVPPVSSLEALPRDVDLAAYRVIQESLTNVLKHAGPDATAHVSVQTLPGSLRVVVSDDGVGASASDDGDGHGIVGMRERVASSGGTLLVGSRPQGGFGVVAT
ncbi:MAG: histidine kinase, partial [Actinomycetota bacterium]|nr:histidine kinase [Actinomycetota bacterium]